MSEKRSVEIALLATLLVTFAHFLDNTVNIATYPEPAWLTPLGVMSAWAALSLLGALGYFLFRISIAAAATVLYLYAALASEGFQHYFYGPLGDFTPKMHALILGEFACALALAVCLTRMLYVRRHGS